MAGDAEVLEQQIAGEDVAVGEVLDRLAVVEDGAARDRRSVFHHQQVQRAQAAFDVAVQQHHVVAISDHRFAAAAEQFVEHRRCEAAAREAQVAELLGVDQAPGAVVFEHQLVLVHHVLARDRLRRREVVADDLEHQRVVGQREHRHDHALGARRVHEALRALLEVAEEMPVALGLGLLQATEHRIPLVHRLARQQRLQEHHGVADGFEVGEEVGAGDAEQHRDIVALGQHRVDADAAISAVAERDHHRRIAIGSEDAPDQIGAALAVEHRFQHLDGADRTLAPMREPAFQIQRQRRSVAAAVGVGHLERNVLEQTVEAVGERVADRVAVARDRMRDAVGGLDAQRHELDVGIDAAGLEEAPRQRVVVGLVQLAIEQTANRLFEGRLDAQP